jgi:hypothetical protein
MNSVGNIRSRRLLKEVELANNASVMEQFFEIFPVFILIEDDRRWGRHLLWLDLISELKIVENRVNQMGLGQLD